MTMNQTATSILIEEDLYTLNAYLDPFNKRIRIDDYLGNTELLIQKAEELVQKHYAEKLIFKVRSEQLSKFFEKGFHPEAIIDSYFLGSDAYYAAKYYKVDRRVNDHWIIEDQIIKGISELKPVQQKIYPPDGYELKKADESNAMDLAAFYKQVFPIYPTPLNDPEYVKKTMLEGTVYYIFIYQGNIVSAASAEINDFYKNAELTDCATLQEHRKYGLMKFLLQELEGELRKKGIYCAYSIARALSFGMNAALLQLGYHYRGRLLNNCYIYDKLESMNMWVKDLASC
jgi:putative beta-lysine N-acetyltransferase